MEHKVECPRCGGLGYNGFINDEGFCEEDTCYHCYGEGSIFMDDDEYVEMVNEQLADANELRQVDRRRYAFDDDMFVESEMFPWIDD